MKITKTLTVMLAVVILLTSLTACSLFKKPAEPEEIASLNIEQAEEKVNEFLEEKLPQIAESYNENAADENVRYYAEGNCLICEKTIAIGDDRAEYVRLALEQQREGVSEEAAKIAKELRKYLKDETATYVVVFVSDTGELIYQLSVPLK